MVVNLCPHEIEPVALVHVNGDSVNLKLLILFALLVEAEDIAHAGAASPFHAHTKSVSVRNVFLANDLSNLLRGIRANVDRGLRSGLRSSSHGGGEDTCERRGCETTVART